MHRDMKTVMTAIKLQLVMVFVAAIITGAVRPIAITSVTYGGIVALLGSVYLLWRMRSTRELASSAQDSLRQVQVTAAVRFAFTVLMLALPAIHRHGFHYAGVMVGFVIGQVAGWLGLAWIRPGEKNKTEQG